MKSGPFGTVKAMRTNPTITPDLSNNRRLAKILEQVAKKALQKKKSCYEERTHSCPGKLYCERDA